MAVEIVERHIALFAGIETTEGTALTYANTTPIYLSEMKRPVKNQKSITRDFSTQTRPTDVSEQDVMTWWDFDFTAPYAYSGTPGVPSLLEVLAKMCGASSVITTATAPATNYVTYAREVRRGLFDSATLFWRTPLVTTDFDYLRKSTGARGQLGFKIALGEDITFSVKGVGNYYQPAQVPKIAPDFGTQKTNIFGAPKVAAITAKTLNGQSLCLQSIDASNFFGWDVEWMEECGGERASPKTSKSGGTLKIQIAMPDWTTEFNPFAYAERATTQRLPFEFIIGSAPGKTLKIAAAEAQAGKPVEIALPNGNAGMELELTILHNPTIAEL